MLQGQDSGGNQHRNLLAVPHRLERGPYGNFGLSEAYIPADKPVHGIGFFHVVLHRCCSALLVGGILVHERRFQLLLHIGVGGKGISFRRLTLGIQLDEVLRYILDLLLGVGLEGYPGFAPQLIDFRGFPVRRAETGYLVKGMDAHEHHVPVLVGEFYHFAGTSLVVVHLHQSSEDAHAVVDMYYIIPYVEGIQVVEGELFGLFHAPSHLHAVETVENLVVGIATNLVFPVYETGVDVLPLHEFGKMTSVHGQYALHPFQL